LGAPCETALRDVAEGWWHGAVAMAMVVWPSGWKRKARGGGLGQKPETEPWGLDFCERCAGGVRFGLWGVDWGGVIWGLGPGSAQSSGA
jgi:hypothetical protein